MVDGSNKGRIRRRRRNGDFSLKPYGSRSKLDVYEKRRKDEKKKKKMTTNKNDFHDDLVANKILSRLPAKCLMRFKSVCKPWKSTIEQDSHFISLHRTRSQTRPRRLLTIVLNGRLRGRFDFLLADLDCGNDDVRGATIQNSWSVKVPSTDTGILGPLRGLLCFIDDFDARVYNFTTRQFVTPWIRSTVLRRSRRVCELGFDPDTGEYKVIFVWHDCCEVLTVGVDSNFRIIDAVPPAPEFIGRDSVYANGSIYWMSKKEGSDSDSDSESLVAFDIGPEKFRTIRIPEFTLSGFHLSPCHYITELDGCPTVVRTKKKPTLKLWKFHDRNKEPSNGSEREEDWSEVSFEKPCYFSPSIGVTFHPIPGNDQIMILETYDRRNIYQKEVLLMNVKLNSFYSYNRLHKTFSKFQIQGISSLPNHARTSCHVLVEEHLFPAAEKKPSE